MKIGMPVQVVFFPNATDGSREIEFFYVSSGRFPFRFSLPRFFPLATERPKMKIGMSLQVVSFSLCDRWVKREVECSMSLQ